MTARQDMASWRLEEPAAAGGHRAFQGQLFQEPPFRELAEWYQARARPTAKRVTTIQGEDSYIRHALEWLARENVERPTTADWKAYLEYRLSPECRLAAGKAGRITALTADSHRAVLQRVYTACRDCPKDGWLLVPNPLAATLLGPCHTGGRQRPRSLAEPDVTYPRLLAAMPGPLERAFVSVLRWHGLRLQEALAIPLPGSAMDAELGGRLLDLSAGTLRIERQRSRDYALRHEPLKTEYSRAVLRLAPEPARLLREALTWRAKQALEERSQRRRPGQAATAWVFPYFKNHLEDLLARHREVAPADFPRRVRGVDGADGWHVYRHTFATEHYRAVLAGQMPGRLLHNLLRHKDPKTTETYLKALNVEVLGGDAVEASWKAQEERIAQAVKERSGLGLTVVTGATGRER